jgi:hypothetical protein
MEDNSNGKEQLSSEKIIEFVRNASSKNKTVGHNKYQNTISNLQRELDNQKTIISNQNEELQLFRNNITSTQLQLQEKIILINELQKQVDEITQSNNDLNNQITDLNIQYKTDIDNLINDNKILKDDNSQLMKINSQSYQKYNEDSNIYIDFKQKYQNITDILDTKIKQNEDLESTVYQLVTENSMYKDTNSKLQTEVNSIKAQLVQYKNENSILKTNIFEKDFLLKQQSKYLADQDAKIDQQIKMLEELSLSSNETIKEPIESPPQPLQSDISTLPINIGEGRGIGKYRSGININRSNIPILTEPVIQEPEPVQQVPLLEPVQQVPLQKPEPIVEQTSTIPEPVQEPEPVKEPEPVQQTSTVPEPVQEPLIEQQEPVQEPVQESNVLEEQQPIIQEVNQDSFNINFHKVYFNSRKNLSHR